MASRMVGFWHSRCLNNCVDLPNMIESLASGTHTSRWQKMELIFFFTAVNKIITSWQILVFEVLQNRIKVADMKILFARGTIASLVTKNGTRTLSQLFKDRFWCSSSLKDHIEVSVMIGSFTCSATVSLDTKNRNKEYSTTVDRVIPSENIFGFRGVWTTISKCPTW